MDICDFSKHGIFQVMKLGMTYIDEKYLFVVCDFDDINDGHRMIECSFIKYAVFWAFSPSIDALDGDIRVS